MHQNRFQSTAAIKESLSDNSSSKSASDRINDMSSSDGNEEKKAKLLINFNEELQALIKPAVAVPLSLAAGIAKDVLQHKIKNVINESI